MIAGLVAVINALRSGELVPGCLAPPEQKKDGEPSYVCQ